MSLSTGNTRVKNRLMREHQRLGDFSPLRGSASSPLPFGGDTLHGSKHPRLWLGTGGRADTSFLASIQKPGSARLIRPDGLDGLRPASRDGQRLVSFPPFGVSPEVKTPPVENSQDFCRGHSQASQREKIPTQATGVFRARSLICSYKFYG